MPANDLAAEILERNAMAFARQTCLRLEQRLAHIQPDLGEDRQAWQADAIQRITELAEALRLSRPELFVEKTVWLARAYLAREVSIDMPRHALLSLRETICQDFPDQSVNTVIEVLDLALSAIQEPIQPLESTLTSAGKGRKLALRFMSACLEGRSDEAIAMVIAAIENSMSPEEVVTDVIVAAQRETGNLWHRHEISIAQEHLVTNTTIELMAVIGNRFARPENARRVLVSGVSGNAHDIGIRAASLLFRLAGWRSITLGTDLPPDEIAAAAEEFDVAVVVLSATISTHVSTLARTIETIRASGNRVPIIVGGAPFVVAADLWKDIGADAMSHDLGSVVSVAASLLKQDAD